MKQVAIIASFAAAAAAAAAATGLPGAGAAALHMPKAMHWRTDNNATRSPAVTPSPTRHPSKSADAPGDVPIRMGGGPAFTMWCAAWCIAAGNATQCSNYVVRFRVVYKAQGWIGVGVGSMHAANPMVGGHAVIGLNDAAKPAVGLYSLSNASMQGVVLVDSAPLDAMGVFNASFTLEDARSVLAFDVDVAKARRWLDLVPDPEGGIASKANTVVMIFAQGGPHRLVLNQHARAAAVNMNVLAVAAAAAASSHVKEVSTALVAHIALALFAFGFALPAGALVAYRRPQGWFAVHLVLQTTGSMAAVGALVAAASHVAQSRSGHLSNAHEELGAVVIAAVVAQLAAGLYRPHAAQDDGDETPSRMRVAWFAKHRVLALFVLLGGGANLLLGGNTFARTFMNGATRYAVGGAEFNAQALQDFAIVWGCLVMCAAIAGVLYGVVVRPRARQVQDIVHLDAYAPLVV